MINRLRKLLCKLLGHRWYGPFGNTLFICKRCGCAYFETIHKSYEEA